MSAAECEAADPLRFALHDNQRAIEDLDETLEQGTADLVEKIEGLIEVAGELEQRFAKCLEGMNACAAAFEGLAEEMAEAVSVLKPT